MLVDAPFARWIQHGEGHPIPGAEGSTPAERFASWERLVHARTNGWAAPRGGLALAWPRALGTPPWGLRHELENGASRVGTQYRIVSLRLHSREALRARYRRLVDLVVDGEPAALYVGNAWLPRHVTLVLPGTGTSELTVYEPSSGRVLPLTQERFAARDLALGGWSVPWILVQPSGHRRAHDGLPATSPWRVPKLSPDPAVELMHRGPGGSEVSSSSA